MADSDTTQQVTAEREELAEIIRADLEAESEALRAKLEAKRADRKAEPLLTTAQWLSVISIGLYLLKN